MNEHHIARILRTALTALEDKDNLSPLLAALALAALSLHRIADHLEFPPDPEPEPDPPQLEDMEF